MPTPRAASRRARVRPRAILAGLAILAVAGALALAYVLLNPSVLPPRSPVPVATAPMSTVARTYMAAAQSQDCGMTRALTTSNTWSWCGNPRLLAYRFVARTGADGECMAYDVTIDSSNPSMARGTEPWSLCFRQTKDGWRLWDQGQG